MSRAERGSRGSCWDTHHWEEVSHTHTRFIWAMSKVSSSFLSCFFTSVVPLTFLFLLLCWCHWCFDFLFSPAFLIVKSLMHSLWTCGRTLTFTSLHHTNSQIYSSLLSWTPRFLSLTCPPRPLFTSPFFLPHFSQMLLFLPSSIFGLIGLCSDRPSRLLWVYWSGLRQRNPHSAPPLSATWICLAHGLSYT